MYGNPSTIPSVQVGAGFPLQTTQTTLAQSAFPQPSVPPSPAMAMPQASVQPNMTPVEAGSLMQVPPGTMVPVNVGGTIYHVPTQPVATQNVLHMSMQPVQTPQYETTSIQVPVETQEQYIPPMENVVPAPQYQHLSTPTVKTLPPRIVRNQLPPQHKQVMLPAKVVQTRLPPLGPPPTPELNLQLPPPVQTVSSVVVPQPVQTVQSIMVPQQVPTIQIPVQTVMAPYSSASVGQIGQVSVPNYTTASVGQLSTPNFGTTSVTQVTPQY